ncbi:MAG: hypothetical protein H6732_19155 [Alphaproteobacteria bacterium]|nr:hypothetical protein [Alphaproteobacteria bacterium]
MSSPTQSSETYRDLVARVRDGATGCLAVGAGSAELAVYLLDGHLLATRASDDTPVLVERLTAAGSLTPDRGRQLLQMQEMSMPILGQHLQDPIIGLLFEEDPTERLDTVLADRFEENVARFVGHRGAPRWEDGVVPWVFNLQIGHDSAALVDKAAAVWALSQGIRDSLEVRRGTAAPDDEVTERLVDAVGSEVRSVAELVDALGVAPLVGKAVVARGLESGLLVDASAVEPGEGAEDEELEAFAGTEDAHRGGSRGGAFVTEAHNLDRVEIEALDDVVTSSNREPSYAAPTLTEADALEKIGVANEVLAVLVRAMDEAAGTKRGRSVVQLLVDGRPRAFVPLLADVQVTARGLLPESAVVVNLRRRPDTEQRRLLNQGLLDLLDRALDRAADELDDEVMDDILAKVMGYRQRLGL